MKDKDSRLIWESYNLREEDVMGHYGRGLGGRVDNPTPERVAANIVSIAIGFVDGGPSEQESEDFDVHVKSSPAEVAEFTGMDEHGAAIAIHGAIIDLIQTNDDVRAYMQSGDVAPYINHALNQFQGHSTPHVQSETFTDGSPANNPDLQTGGMYTASHDEWSDDSQATVIHDLMNMVDRGERPIIQFSDGQDINQASIDEYEQDSQDDGRVYFFGNTEDGVEVSVNGLDVDEILGQPEPEVNWPADRWKGGLPQDNPAPPGSGITVKPFGTKTRD